MARRIGSQLRETLKESGYTLIARQPGAVLLMSPTGTKELWGANDHHAGYTIQVGRWGYEFCHDIHDATPEAAVARWWNGREMIGTIPEAAVQECTVGGQDASEPIEQWVTRLEFNAPVAETREYLKGYGAWDDAELADHQANVRRLFWILCGSIAEGDDCCYLDS